MDKGIARRGGRESPCAAVEDVVVHVKSHQVDVLRYFWPGDLVERPGPSATKRIFTRILKIQASLNNKNLDNEKK